MARKENRILKGGRNMNLKEVQGLKKGFGSVSVLTDVSFTVEKGDVIAVIGPSGAGKSTAIEKTRAVSLINVIDSFVIEGSATRIICGRITRTVVCTRLNPSTWHASYCPRSIASRPPRKISAKYAA